MTTARFSFPTFAKSLCFGIALAAGLGITVANALAKGGEEIPILVEQANAASESGDFWTACDKSNQAIRALRAAEKSARVESFVKQIEGLGYCKKANEMNDAFKLLGGLMQMSRCSEQGARYAKERCAPAPNFAACMKRLGFEGCE
jgi:hypothetical protein